MELKQKQSLMGAAVPAAAIHLGPQGGAGRNACLSFSLEDTSRHTSPAVLLEDPALVTCRECLTAAPTVGHRRVWAHHQLLGATKNWEGDRTITKV